MVWNPDVESRPHPFGEVGVRSSLEAVCERAAKGASGILGSPKELARVRTYAIKLLSEAKTQGQQVHRPGHRARVLLTAVQNRKLWVPDPIGIEYIPAAHLMACDGPAHDDGTPCFAGDDCDGKVVLLAAMFMAVGLYTMIVGHSYDRSKQISHVLTKVYFDGKWHYADPSQLSNGTHQALGVCIPYTRERYYSMPEIKVVCDGTSCDAKSFDPEEAGFITKGTFVGVNGIPVEELPPEIAIRWLGAELGPVPESCKTTPYSLDRYTFQKYAERCGTEIALKWVTNQTGVDVHGCNGKGAKATVECVANNYGATIDLINKDGSVNWDNVVRDAGAVSGILVCAAIGAGAAAPICGKIGAQVAQVLETIAVSVGKAILDFFWGGSDGGGWACGKFPFNGVPLPQMARNIAAFMKVAKTYGSYKQDMLIGPPLFGTLEFNKANIGGIQYWSRMMTLRGMAEATASLAAEISYRTGASGATSIQALAPIAPPGWSDLVNPMFSPTTPGTSNDAAPTPDYQGTIGGLLTATIRPDLTGIFMIDWQGDPPIVPQWMGSKFWAGVTSSQKSVWRYFMVVGGCPNDTVVWGDINPEQAKKKLTTLPGNAGHNDHQSYIVYSVPSNIEYLVVTATNQDFQEILDLWKKSISTNLDKKMATARSLSAPKAGTLSKVVLAAGAGVAAWFGWRYFIA